MKYTVLMHRATYQRTERYLLSLRQGASAGALLQQHLEGKSWQQYDVASFLECLFQTKIPRIFAESEVAGDGSDWNPAELAILGDLGVAVEVSAFDNGRHQAPEIHAEPLPMTLLFTPGALLEGGSRQPADWAEVVHDKQIDLDAYKALYERRLLPLFRYAQERAAAVGRAAVITCPGLGCGQFAGPFSGRLGTCLEQSLIHLLQKHAFPDIALVHYDPYGECRNESYAFGRTRLNVRPLTQGNQGTPQLCRSEAYGGAVDAELFSLVAWDHVSWPGNDFYAGVRATDDGVKAAATDSMYQITGIKGSYNPTSHAYEPPSGCQTWQQVVFKHGISLKLKDRLRVYDS